MIFIVWNSETPKTSKKLFGCPKFHNLKKTSKKDFGFRNSETQILSSTILDKTCWDTLKKLKSGYVCYSYINNFHSEFPENAKISQNVDFLNKWKFGSVQSSLEGLKVFTWHGYTVANYFDVV